MSKQDIEKRLGFAAQGVKETTRTSAKATFAEFNVGDKVVYVPDSSHIDAYGRIIKIENGIAIIASAEGNVKAKLSDLELVKKGSVEDLRRLGMKGFARPGVKAKMETPMRVALTPMHTRAEQGYENFIAVLMKFGGITREQAQKAFKAFKDAKVLVTKEQYMGGGITVKHGAFMERDVIRRAAGLPEESSRPGAKAKMGLEMNMLDFRHKFFTAFGTAIRDAKSNPNTAEAQSDETVLRESWASMFAQGYSDAISDLNGLSATMKSKTSVGQMRKAASDAMEAYRQAKAAVRSSRPGAKAKMAAEIASDPRDKDFEKLKTLKGVVHQGKGFYIIPNKLMTPERRTKVKRSTQRYELSSMGDLVGWGTNHPNVNDYRLKDWAEAFA